MIMNVNEATFDPVLRSELFLRHPLLTADEILMTPPIKELYLVVKRAVRLREPGSCFTAPSGVGKTTALCMIAKMLRNEIPNLTIYEHDTQNQQFPSIRAFFKNFLHTIKHHEMKGETYDLRLRVTNRLIDDARVSGLNIVVLLIDEAQAMSIQDFLFLKDIDNTLNREGVKLVSVMMGQDPDFQAVLRKLKDQRRLDLIARFTMREIPFRAFNTLADFNQILDGIDIAVFPENSTLTWTEFFFPKAHAGGFRMKNEAASFFSALTKISLSCGDQHSFPARQVFLAIRSFMTDNAAYDSSNPNIPPDAWSRAIQYAQIEEAMILMHATDVDLKVRL